MTKRSQDWNEGLSKDLRNREFAQEFIIGLLEEGFSLEDALRKVVRTYGVKEFAEKIGMARTNLSRLISSRHNPTRKTIEQLLKPFDLELTVIPARKPPRKARARKQKKSAA